MVKTGDVEKRIFLIEGFRVKIKNYIGITPSGGNLRMYRNYKTQARDSWTVREWIDKRFSRGNKSIMVEVLDRKGKPVWHNTSLFTVRDTYK